MARVESAELVQPHIRMPQARILSLPSEVELDTEVAVVAEQVGREERPGVEGEAHPLGENLWAGWVGG